MARQVMKFIPEEDVKTINGKYLGEFNFDGTIKQVLVVPETPTTIYDFGIKDETGMVIYSKFDQKGFLASDDLSIIVFPGIKSFIIENATKDERFRVKIIYQL